MRELETALLAQPTLQLQTIYSGLFKLEHTPRCRPRPRSQLLSQHQKQDHFLGEEARTLTLCVLASSRAFSGCAAWADPYRTWLERKGEGKGESPRVLIPSGPREKAASGPSLLLRQPPLFPDNNTGQATGELDEENNQAKTMKETHIQETKAKDKWAFVSPCTYLPLSQHQDGGELDTGKEQV